jgi:hypothetical protein
MKRNTRFCHAAVAGLAAVGLGLVTIGFTLVALAQELPSKADIEMVQQKGQQKKSDYSPYVDQDFPTRVFWGDTHHHSSYSFDAGLANMLSPEVSYRFARGEKIVPATDTHRCRLADAKFGSVTQKANTTLGAIEIVIGFRFQQLPFGGITGISRGDILV